MDQKFKPLEALTLSFIRTLLNLPLKFVINWETMMKTCKFWKRVFWKCTCCKWYTETSNQATSCSAKLSRKTFLLILEDLKCLRKLLEKKQWHDSSGQHNIVLTKYLTFCRWKKIMWICISMICMDWKNLFYKHQAHRSWWIKAKKT